MKSAPSPIRECDGCTLCCKVMVVQTFQKPGGVWCQHCDPSRGCTIHQSRPDECRGFHCGFLLYPELDESWRPSISRLIVTVNAESRRYEIHVDPQRPEAWRQEPYHSRLRELARSALAQKMVVIVFIRNRIWVVYPDRDVDLGMAQPGDRAVAKLIMTPDGARYEVVKLGKDDPSA